MPRYVVGLSLAVTTTIILALVLTSSAAAAVSTGNGGWSWQNPLPQGGDLSGGYFLDANRGWLISGGTIFHTSDGGATLAVQARHNVVFRDITFVDATHGWAVGDPATRLTGTGIIYRTTNGGKSWVRVRLTAVGGVEAVSFASRRVGWAVCARTVLRSVDGGLHWTVQAHAIRLFNDVVALSKRRVWAVGNKDTLLRTLDAGATWKRVYPGTPESLTAIQFTNAEDGWIAGEKTIFHTSDGGAHWLSQASLGPGLSGLSFADAENGWVTSLGSYPSFASAVYHTADGGAHWVQQTGAPVAGWVVALSPSAALLGGDGGRVARTFDGGASWQSSWRTTADFSGTLDAVQFLSATTGWAAGSGGEILKTTNGGSSWTAQASETTEDISKVDFIDVREGWAVGKQGAIVHTADGGATWTPQASGITDDLGGVAFADSQHGWAVGGTVDQYGDSSTGVILATSDGGQHWAKQATPIADAALSDVVFADARRGWAVGEVVGDSSANVTVILATKDGGATWTKQLQYMPPITGNTSQGVLTSIACIDATHLVAVGSDSSSTEIFRTSNGGVTWTRFVPPASWGPYPLLYLTDVVFVDATHGWAVCPSSISGLGAGIVLETTDGGISWTKESVAPTAARAVSFVSRTRGWAVGDGANILATTTGGSAPRGGKAAHRVFRNSQ